MFPIATLPTHFAIFLNMPISAATVTTGPRPFPKSIFDFHDSTFDPSMNANAFISFLLTLSIRQRLSTPVSPWKFRLGTLAFSAVLHVWRLYKSAYGTITGQGAIERLCNSVLPTQNFRTVEKRIEFEGRGAKNVVWRIGIPSSKLLLNSETQSSVCPQC
jgi:hypothetical protein